MHKILTGFAFLVVAMGAYEVVLPDVGFGVRLALAHGFFLANALLILYLLVLLCSGRLLKLGPILAHPSAAKYTLLIVSLGLLGVVSAGINQTGMLDFGQAARLLLYSAYFVLVIFWSTTRGTTFALRAYLAGITCGTLINLYYTLVSPPYRVFDFLPVLCASNGAGGHIAISMLLAAWLWMTRKSRYDGRVAIAMAAVGMCAVALSYSKTAMLIGVLGVFAWLTVIFHVTVRSVGKLVLMGTLAVLASLIVLTTPVGEMLRAATEPLVRSVQVKFGWMNFESKFGIDNYNITGSRYAYWPMTFKVLAANPILGVGYSGLYDAYAGAREGYEDLALDEGARTRTTNPHNSFLYYIAANGIFAALMVSMLYLISLQFLYRSCAAYGLAGRIVWVCLAISYFIYGFTLPTLFNTEILYLPAAVALVQSKNMVGPRRQIKRLLGFAGGGTKHARLWG